MGSQPDPLVRNYLFSAALEIEYRAGPDRSQMEFSRVTRQVQFTFGVIVIMIVNVATSTAP
jgi:hypothetical protein